MLSTTTSDLLKSTQWIHWSYDEIVFQSNNVIYDCDDDIIAIVLSSPNKKFRFYKFKQFAT